jgi:hypothetical protein
MAPSARVMPYIDADSDANVATVGALTVVTARCNEQSVRLILTDPSVAGGSFGVEECELLERVCRHSIADRLPIVLVLDSGGARLTSGLAGLGAFRRMYRAALDARRSAVPMIAVVERNCFGGASMLAMLCPVRAMAKTARIGMSGPAIIEKLSGRNELDATDRDAVNKLFGAVSRTAAGVVEETFDPDASRCQLLPRLLSIAAVDNRDLHARHQQMRRRLLDAGVTASVPDFTEAAAAFNRGRFVGARDIWQLADAVLSAPPEETLIVTVNCPGQAATRQDETLVLSEYVAHLAQCLRERSATAGEIVMRIVGESAGGIFVALAAGATRVEALPQATIRVLPTAAVQVVLSTTTPEETVSDALRAGCVDRIIQTDSSEGACEVSDANQP